jgi:hypothetical protein
MYEYLKLTLNGNPFSIEVTKGKAVLYFGSVPLIVVQETQPDVRMDVTLLELTLQMVKSIGPGAAEKDRLFSREEREHIFDITDYAMAAAMRIPQDFPTVKMVNTSIKISPEIFDWEHKDVDPATLNRVIEKAKKDLDRKLTEDFARGMGWMQ